MSLFNELKRRNVLRVTAAYVVVAWLLIQVAETLFPLFGFDDTPARIVVIVLAIGLIPTLVFSWAFELTPEGLKKESAIDRAQSITPRTGKKLDRMIMVVLALALGYFAFDKFLLAPQREIELSEQATRLGADQAMEEARLGMFDDKSVAVLPFVNRSEQKEDEYFADGMHDELLTRLSNIAALKVISRTSVMRYRDTIKSIPEIGKELAVAAILEGGVQRSGDQVRINVQLINTHTDEHIWAEVYDRKLTVENLFAIQSEISSVIAKALQTTLTPEEESRIHQLPTDNMDAYNHFLRGRQLMASRRVEDMKLAAAEFKQATDIDPNFALAWVGVADSVHLVFESNFNDLAGHLKDHKRAAEKALALDDGLGEAYASLGFYYVDNNEHEKAEAALRKSIELNPNYVQAYHWYSNILTGVDRTKKRLDLLYKAAQLDPMSSVVQTNIAVTLWNLGRKEKARQRAEQILEIDPNFSYVYEILGDMDAEDGRLDLARQWYLKGLELDPASRGLLVASSLVYLAVGDLDGAARLGDVMDQYFGPGSLPRGVLDWRLLLVQGKWREMISLAQNLPPEFQEMPFVLGVYRNTYMFSGDFDQANRYTLKLQPFLVDREKWQVEFTDSQRFDCESAAILAKSGDGVLGRDLLQLFIRNFEDPALSQEIHENSALDMINCYLADGSIDKALDILDREATRGRLLVVWWSMSKLPWWEPYLDNPRFLELVARVKQLLDDQNARLIASDNSEHAML